jgi:hypothetical protein
MEAFFAREEYLAGSLAGIRGVARHLREHFGSPASRRNELPDEPRLC